MSNCTVSTTSARRSTAALARRRRVLLGVGALLLAGGGLAACGSSSAHPSASATSSVPASTPSIGGARTLLASAATGAAGLRSAAFEASVVLSGLPPAADAGRASLTIDAAGKFDVAGGLAEATVTTSASPSALAVVVDRASGLVYVKLPAALRGRLAAVAGAPVTTPWVALALPALPGSGVSGAGGDLGSLRSALRGVVASAVQVEDAGPAVVDGVPVRRLVARVDLARLVAGLLGKAGGTAGESSTGSGAGLLGALGALLVPALAGTTVTVQVMVGRSGHLRRIEASLPVGRILSALVSRLRSMFGGTSGASGLAEPSPTMSSLSALGHLVIDVTVTFSRYDAAGPIVVPPASEVTVLRGVSAVSQLGALGGLGSLGSLGI